MFLSHQTIILNVVTPSKYKRCKNSLTDSRYSVQLDGNNSGGVILPEKVFRRKTEETEKRADRQGTK